MPRASDPEFTALFTPGDPEVIFSDLKVSFDYFKWSIVFNPIINYIIY